VALAALPSCCPCRRCPRRARWTGGTKSVPTRRPTTSRVWSGWRYRRATPTSRPSTACSRSAPMLWNSSSTSVHSSASRMRCLGRCSACGARSVQPRRLRRGRRSRHR